MAQSATLTALGEIVQEIRGKGHFGNCQKNSQEYVDWCSWILGTRERLLALGAKLSLSTNEAIKGVDFDWDDWISVSAAIERIHAIAYLVEDDVRMPVRRQALQTRWRRFETTSIHTRRSTLWETAERGMCFLLSATMASLLRSRY